MVKWVLKNPKSFVNKIQTNNPVYFWVDIDMLVKYSNSRIDLVNLSRSIKIIMINNLL